MGEISVNVPRVYLIKGRYYWQPTKAVRALGFSPEALGHDPIKAMRRGQELNAQVKAERQGHGPAVRDGSVAHLIRLYRESDHWARLRGSTRKGYDRILKEIEAKAGGVAVRAVTRKDMADTYRKLRTRGLAQANAFMRVWRIILGYAWDQGWVETNPAQKMRLVAPPGRERVWTTGELEAFRKAAEAAGCPSMGLAVDLAHQLGQRQGDVLGLTWAQWNGQAFEVSQSKTGARLSIPVFSGLRKRLNAMPRTAVQVIVSEATGRPYRADHFRHEVHRIKTLAGLPPDLQFRDLRRTTATEIGAASGTDDEIRSVTGHKSRGVVAVYVRPDSRYATSAQRKREKAAKKNRPGPDV